MTFPFKLDLFHNYKHFFVVAVEWSSLLEWIILLQYIVKNSAADLLISSLEQKIKSTQRIVFHLKEQNKSE